MPALAGISLRCMRIDLVLKGSVSGSAGRINSYSKLEKKNIRTYSRIDHVSTDDMKKYAKGTVQDFPSACRYWT